MSEYSPRVKLRTDASAFSVEDDSIHAQLRQATADQHHRFERGLGYILSDTLSRGRYTDLLAALFGFYGPLEDHLSQWQGTSTLLALPLIRRTGLLERDLRAFGLVPDQVPRCVEMPTLTSIDHAAGALYVVEGACLGGQVIARAVMQRLRIAQEDGAAFFSGDGAHVDARWKHVLDWLEERDGGACVRHEIVAGASRTFAALALWLLTREALDA